MRGARRWSAAGKGLVNKAIHLGCSLGSFVLRVGSGAQVCKHGNLAGKALPRKLPPARGWEGWEAARLHARPAQRGGWQRLRRDRHRHPAIPPGCPLLPAAAACLAEVAVPGGLEQGRSPGSPSLISGCCNDAAAPFALFVFRSPCK